MKKILTLFIVATLLLTAAAIPASAANAGVVTMYAPDGRTINVQSYEVAAYRNVGWYDYPVTTLYAPGFKTAVVASWEVPAYTSVGWFTYPVIYVFDDYYNAYLINAYEAEYYENLGYYLPIYCDNGITIGTGDATYYYHYNSWGTVTSIDYLDMSYIVINNSGKDLRLSPDYITVNGYASVSGGISDIIPAGATQCATIRAYGSQIYSQGVRTINEVDFALNVYSTDYSFYDITEDSGFVF